MGLTFLYPSLHLLVLKVFLRHHSDDHVDFKLGPTPTIHPEVVPPVSNPAGARRWQSTPGAMSTLITALRRPLLQNQETLKLAGQ